MTRFEVVVQHAPMSTPTIHRFRTEQDARVFADSIRDAHYVGVSVGRRSIVGKAKWRRTAPLVETR